MTSNDNLEGDIDLLFDQPLAQFTAARNALATRLKKDGRAGDSERVRSLAKPSVSAWAVNQLYWKHRDAFDALIAAGNRLRSAHTAQLTNKDADTRGPSAARREALARLLQLADALLRNSGHSPTPETMRRISTTLEALSAGVSTLGVSAGRLTGDVDSPGFESLAGLVPEIGHVKVAQDARAQTDAAAKAQRDAQADAAAKAARDAQAQERLEKAAAAAHEARGRVHNLTVELERARGLLEEAERRLELAREDVRERRRS
jgi:hypothetical protein